MTLNSVKTHGDASAASPDALQEVREEQLVLGEPRHLYSRTETAQVVDLGVVELREIGGQAKLVYTVPQRGKTVEEYVIAQPGGKPKTITIGRPGSAAPIKGEARMLVENENLLSIGLTATRDEDNAALAGLATQCVTLVVDEAGTVTLRASSQGGLFHGEGVDPLHCIKPMADVPVARPLGEQREKGQPRASAVASLVVRIRELLGLNGAL